MQRTTIEDAERDWAVASARRRIGEALGAENVAISHYTVEPDQPLGGVVHAHHDQEEIFYVLSGTITFDTEDGEVAVGAGEAIRFAPGEFQTSYNDGDERATVLALGAPRDSELSEQRIECPECGSVSKYDYEPTEDGEAKVLACRSCGAEVFRATK